MGNILKIENETHSSKFSHQQNVEQWKKLFPRCKFYFHEAMHLMCFTIVHRKSFLYCNGWEQKLASQFLKKADKNRHTLYLSKMIYFQGLYFYLLCQVGSHINAVTLIDHELWQWGTMWIIFSSLTAQKFVFMRVLCPSNEKPHSC